MSTGLIDQAMDYLADFVTPQNVTVTPKTGFTIKTNALKQNGNTVCGSLIFRPSSSTSAYTQIATFSPAPTGNTECVMVLEASGSVYGGYIDSMGVFKTRAAMPTVGDYYCLITYSI